MPIFDFNYMAGIDTEFDFPDIIFSSPSISVDYLEPRYTYYFEDPIIQYEYEKPKMKTCFVCGNKFTNEKYCPHCGVYLPQIFYDEKYI